MGRFEPGPKPTTVPSEEAIVKAKTFLHVDPEELFDDDTSKPTVKEDTKCIVLEHALVFDLEWATQIMLDDGVWWVAAPQVVSL